MINHSDHFYEVIKLFRTDYVISMLTHWIRDWGFVLGTCVLWCSCSQLAVYYDFFNQYLKTKIRNTDRENGSKHLLDNVSAFLELGTQNDDEILDYRTIFINQVLLVLL